LKCALIGDANLDGIVNELAANFNKGATGASIAPAHQATPPSSPSAKPTA
jgi:hypothetical protein